ncbi:MAG: DUF1353 domain-containing protein [Parvularculaceae bacterium]
MRPILLLALIVGGALCFFDSPMVAAQRAVGMPVETEGSRQAIAALRIAVDLDGRRMGRRVAVLTDDWLYCYPETGEVFLVPGGYETDFASIPAAARWAISPFGNHAEAAVIHDWLYAVGEKDKRLQADEIFRHAMKENGVNVVRRNLMFEAVRRGGDKSYGAAEEWRFRDPRTLEHLAEPPLARPDKAAVDVIDCEELDVETPRIFEEHAGR